jgi:hypothetical protein
VNGDPKRTNENGSFLVGWLIGLCFDCSSRLSTKYFSITEQFFNSFASIAQQTGQATVLGRLAISVFLWAGHHITMT